MISNDIEIVREIPPQMKAQAIRIYDSALQGTVLENLLSSRQRGELLNEVLDLRFALSAIYRGELAGIAGFHNHKGSLTGASSPLRLCKTLGAKTFVRLLLNQASCYRPLRHDELLHNGLAVDPKLRNKGIGSMLLEEMVKLSLEQKKSCIRLDAMLSNQSALSLYQKAGYKPEALNYLKHGTMLTLRRYLKTSPTV